ncbi:MAG: BamA/TamA family outer membrane protein [Pyrinomonadaceae bacterium]|nr:BamA/TamA family outer membrane protein [Pyrinomonadaceae bacterium]
MLCLFFTFSNTFAQQKIAENTPISDVFVRFEGDDKDINAAEQFKLILKPVVGDKYSTVKIREAIQTLFDTEKIANVRVEKEEVSPNRLNLRFIIKRKTQAQKVQFKIGETIGEPVTEEELLLKLNILNAGSSITEQVLRNNADEIQNYLRERGFYNADVGFSQQILGSDTQVAVTFDVKPNTQARVENFEIDIKDFDVSKIRPKLKLQNGAFFSRKALTDDIEKIRQSILSNGNLAPFFDDTKILFDPDKNTVSINQKGEIGAKVNIKISVEKQKVGEKTQKKLLPIKREGTLDFSAITEGARRLRNRFQEQGYFFVEVEAVCSVTPEFPKDDINPMVNGTNKLCQDLSSADLTSRTVEVDYQVNLNRRLKLADLRIEGTDKLNIPEIVSVLETQEATSLGIVPQFGYGRGYTSNEILNEDRNTIESLMRELGYRDARARIKQGVSLKGDSLIITFVVKEGVPTRIADVEISGNQVFSDATLQTELPNLVGKNYSRARARNGVEKIAAFYAKQGYYDAKIDYSKIELGKDADTGEDQVKIIFNVQNEGKKVIVNRVLINGNIETKRESIERAINLRPNQILLSPDINQTEQVLYSTDAFRRVEVKIEPAGENNKGEKQVDAIINLEEQKSREIIYGGGFSTDLGWSGNFGIKYFNLFGKLQQGGARVRWSRRQQLVQFDFLDPRFLPDGKNRFAPLSITAQYQRDSTVTRFFRSAFDQGTFGVVQRVDANGVPVDIFGQNAGDPTINRFSIIAETNRTISQKQRSIFFLRYKFEDVRLFNIDSLLISDLLQPDKKIRISGLGATFVRDTRENCSKKYSLLELIAKGEIGNPCRYNASDPTKGDYLTIDYNSSLEQIGGNISFQKFQASYQTYYTSKTLRNTTFAGRAVLGLANTWGNRTRFATGVFQDLNGSLPISERFFGGGSTTLRGFSFEEAGPRIVIQPQGNFFNSSGQQVFLNPFTVPFGGNALAITNLEARVPINKDLQFVSFYDGGNIFRRVSDIFKKPTLTNSITEQNLRAKWTNTFGVGLRIKTPIGGSLAIDYGWMTNPPTFLIPQATGGTADYRLKQGQLHFRFSQIF